LSQAEHRGPGESKAKGGPAAWMSSGANKRGIIKKTFGIAVQNARDGNVRICKMHEGRSMRPGILLF
jgi:hypothetical protein